MSIAIAEAHDERGGRGAPRHFTLLDRGGQEYDFTGWRLGTASTENSEARRWTELETYLTIGGNYILRVLGRSVEYHRSGSSCNTGEPTRAGDMDLDLLPCRRCKPSADYMNPARGDEIFDVEVDIPTLRISNSPRGFINSLHWNNGGASELSLVAFRLLRGVRIVDPKIDAELRKSQHLQ